MLRPGGLTWQRIFVADGGHAVFDPDDPYRMHISYFAGLVALQFPALLDRVVPGFADRRAERSRSASSISTLTDGSPFVPETERHPNRAGRLLHARDGRLWGMHGGQGERMRPSRWGARSSSACSRRRPRRPPPPPPPPPAAPTDLTIGDTQGAWRLGLVPGRYVRPGRGAVLLRSRVPAPYVARRGRHARADDQRDRVRRDVQRRRRHRRRRRDRRRRRPPRHGRRAAGRRRPARGPPSHLGDAERGPPRRPRRAVRRSGPRQIALDGNALDATADGLSRLGLNAGTYVGDAHGAAVMLGFAGLDLPERRINRDLSAAPTLSVGGQRRGRRRRRAVGGSFADPARVTTGELADVDPGRAGRPAGRRPRRPPVRTRAAPGRARLRACASAARPPIASPPGRTGRRACRSASRPLAARHAGNHVRNHSSLDLRPVPVAGPPLCSSSSATASTPRHRCVHRRQLRRRCARSPRRAEPADRRPPRRPPGRAGDVRAGDRSRSPAGVRDPLQPGRRRRDLGRAARRLRVPDSDDGVTWTDVTDPAMRRMDRPVEAIACHPPPAETIYVGLIGDGAAADDPGFLFKTTTGGPPWQQIGHPDRRRAHGRRQRRSAARRHAPSSSTPPTPRSSTSGPRPACSARPTAAPRGRRSARGCPTRRSSTSPSSR